ncbi:MAG: hypothetical protein ACKPKO_17820, partial [Candidatus Fonsibacter sp.]
VPLGSLASLVPAPSVPSNIMTYTVALFSLPPETLICSLPPPSMHLGSTTSPLSFPARLPTTVNSLLSPHLLNFLLLLLVIRFLCNNCLEEASAAPLHEDLTLLPLGRSSQST